MFFGLNDVAFLAAVSAPALDPDAAAYIAAVEAADTQALEPAVRAAINDFVIGCKADGIWSAIKASCIMAGARTRLGAMVPLVGAAPTSFNFVDGDYNRKTGLVGDESTKYLDSNRNNNADPQDSNHNAVYVSFIGSYGTTTRVYIGSSGSSAVNGSNVILQNSNAGVFTRNRSANGTASNAAPVAGLIAVNRSSSSSYILRNNKINTTVNVNSQSADSVNINIYRRNDPIAFSYTNARISFYSIGESLDLALLDARVTALINAIAAAI